MGLSLYRSLSPSLHAHTYVNKVRLFVVCFSFLPPVHSSFLLVRLCANKELRFCFFRRQDVVTKFLARTDLDLVCRAHQVVEDGYEFFAQRQLVTVFSAPNYCGEFDNSGAMMTVDENLMCSFQVLKPADKQSKLSALARGKTPPKKPS